MHRRIRVTKAKTGDYNENDRIAPLKYREYKERYEEEMNRLKKINQNIQTIEHKIVSQKEAIGGVNAGIENQNSLVKQIKILENRLDKANQKFNEAISVNKSLRQQIDSLRRERVIFDK